MNNLKNTFFLLSLSIVMNAPAQDSLKTLSAQQVMEIVKRFHPVAKQADIFIEKSKANITIARGMFDPVLSNLTAQKTFDGSNYYYYNQSQIDIPTWFGIELNAGISYLSGTRTDPQDTKGETSYVGINIPLAKNLLMDKRRAALQTAKIFREASVAEKRSVINDLLLDAMTAYWEWVEQYQYYKIISDAVAVNEKRIQLIQIAYRQGDRPAIDTTEALAQLQHFQLLQTEAWMQFQNQGLNLSCYLWTHNNLPYVLPPDILPDQKVLSNNIPDAELPQLIPLLETAMQQHPELLKYNFKLDGLAIETKLKFQELMPSINFRYNQLGKNYTLFKTAAGPFFENNFQYSLNITMPLRLSEGRGEYKKVKLALTATRLQQNQKQLVVQNKVKSYYNELTVVKKQITIQEKIFHNYMTLLRGEETRLKTGEGSLFLVNARENKTLEALQKFTALRIRYFKTTVMLYWAAGIAVLI
jgi:outer membrane protein TolC